MKKKTKIIIILALLVVIVCLVIGGVMFFNRELIVGRSIKSGDIKEFYFTYDSSTNPPEYQRYYLYAKDGKYYFMHEKREGDHWPLTEADATVKGTVELDSKQWEEFFDCLIDGKVTERKDSDSTGNKGPYLYIYWTKDKGKYQKYEFASYDKQKRFEEMCQKMR